MVPLCYRSATVNGLKNPACILHAPYCDVQDANEMRTVENAKRNETYGTDTRDIRDDSYFKKSTATRNEQRWGVKGLFLHAQEYYSVLTSLVAFIVN